MRNRQFALVTASAVALAGLAPYAARAENAGGVSSQMLLNAGGDSDEWLMYGRDYANQRFSPLDQITPDNIKQLRPSFAFSTGGKLGGLEATPLFHDGMLYFSADYSRVFAIDARTGTMVWEFRPRFAKGLDAELCCGPVNRGVALKDGLLYLETLDARLIALDRKTGKMVWQQQIEDWKHGYSATGAPLVVGDRVIAGISGGEYGIRGAVRAYDAKTGKLEWTTYTIPGPGEPGNDTWPGDTWKTGGGATWDTGSYDPASKTLYWGTGNPASWNADLRPGDNKWTCSLLALDIDTGKIKWGFQYTPHDAWDYDGVNTPVLVDATVEGQPRKVAVQSNRNGFLYMIDRANGKFIAAVPTIPGINWARGLDPQTGRPNIDPAMVPKAGGPKISGIIPALDGGTNWFPMAYSPDLNYVFLNTNDWAASIKAWKPADTKYHPGEVYMGADYQTARLGKNIGYVKAFDLTSGKFAWSVPSPLPLFSGLLATKSGLVFTGDELGHLLAFDARTGKELWRFQTGSGVNASPITYQLDGVQYVAILSGLGGDPSYYYSSPKGGMLWVFALNGGKVNDAGHYSQQAIPGTLPAN